MNKFGPSFSRAPITLADILAAVKCLPSLTDRENKKKAELTSSLNTIGRLLNKNLVDLPADAASLRHLLDGIHHIQAGVGAKRLGNAKSDLTVALRLTASRFAVSRPDELSPKRRTAEWKGFLAGLETDWQRFTLARLATFCSIFDYSPKRMCDAILDRFRAYLFEIEVSKDPDAICKPVAQTWNGAVTRLALDLPLLTAPKAHRYQAIPLAEFPASFQEEVRSYLDRLAHVDADTDGPAKPLAEESVRNVRSIICQFATALVSRGRPVESIVSLRVLVEIDNFKAAIRFFLERNDGEPPRWLWGMLGKIMSVAKYFVKLPEADLAELQAVRAKVRVETEGLTEKNRARLDQFYDINNFDLLQLLPDRLLKKAEQLRRSAEQEGEHSIRAAYLVMYAVAVAILLAAPLRSKNLAAINVAANFKRHGQGNSQTLTLFIPGPSVKNKVTFEGPIPRDTTRLIRIYLKSYRPLICAHPGEWLFPWPSGGPRAQSHLAHDMCKLIWRETGLVMNAHLFRHLAGLMWLRYHPGDYETVRQMLGHKKLETTIGFYTGLNTKWAVARYQNEVLVKKGGQK
jgi:integrase